MSWGGGGGGTSCCSNSQAAAGSGEWSRQKGGVLQCCRAAGPGEKGFGVCVFCVLVGRGVSWGGGGVLHAAAIVKRQQVLVSGADRRGGVLQCCRAASPGEKGFGVCVCVLGWGGGWVLCAAATVKGQWVLVRGAASRLRGEASCSDAEVQAQVRQALCVGVGVGGVLPAAATVGGAAGSGEGSNCRQRGGNILQHCRAASPGETGFDVCGWGVCVYVVGGWGCVWWWRWGGYSMGLEVGVLHAATTVGGTAGSGVGGGGAGGHLAVLLWGHASTAAGGTLPEPGSCVGCVGGISSDGADPPNPQPPPCITPPHLLSRGNKLELTCM